jgi:hypothetical protein
MLGNVSNSFAHGTLDVGKKWAFVAVRPGNRATLHATRSVGWAASIRTMLKSIRSILAVTCAPQVAGFAAITVAVTEADTISFRASKAVDRQTVWGSWRQALHNRLSKIGATNLWGDNIMETSLGVGVDILCKTV